MFIVNQKVVCIDDDFSVEARAIYDDLPVKDSTYTIRKVLMGIRDWKTVKSSQNPINFVGSPDVAVLLHELTNPCHAVSGEEYAFRADRFSPLQELTEEEIEKMVNEQEREQELDNTSPREKELVEIERM